MHWLSYNAQFLSTCYYFVVIEPKYPSIHRILPVLCIIWLLGRCLGGWRMGRRRREKKDGEKENEAEGVVLIETSFGVWSF